MRTSWLLVGATLALAATLGRAKEDDEIEVESIEKPKAAPKKEKAKNAPPPPAPRRCIDKGVENLRLNASYTSTDTEGGSDTPSVQSVSTKDSYLWEGATGNWATESVGLHSAICSLNTCDIDSLGWLKAVFVATANRTFLIQGNLTDGGAPAPATACTSSAGQDIEKMYLVSPVMTFMFGGEAKNGADAGCAELWTSALPRHGGIP